MTREAPPGHGRSFDYNPRTGSNRFEKLFSVAVTHTYYTQDHGLCRDLRFAPEAASAELLAALGLLFKEEAGGFSVLIQPASLDRLVKYLRAQAQGSPEQPEYWTRLTFLMSMVNPLFIGITALPVCTKPTLVNLFGSNLQAHGKGAVATLPPGRFMDGGALHPVVGSQASLKVPPDAAAVTLADLSGAIVQRFPVTARDKATDLTAMTVDLSGLAYDLYTFDLEDHDGQPVACPGYPRSMLHVPAQPVTIGLLDILFTQPTPDSAGVYPLSRPSDADADTPSYRLTYQLPFDARSTYWHYYVVPQTPDSTLDGLRIDGQGTSFRRRQKPVPLPDGSMAVLFEAQSALPLRQSSPQRFRLSGQRHDPGGQENDILVDRLPVAPPAPVWPSPDSRGAGRRNAGTRRTDGPRTDGQRTGGQDVNGLSEIFVYV